MTRQRPIHVTLVLAMLLILAHPGWVSARAESFTVVETFPINFVIEGCEEPIKLSGQLHSVFHVTLDNQGGFHLVITTNPQGVTGVGLISGTTYQGTGVGRFNVNGKVGFETTRVDSFKIIGRGTADNNLVQATSHITVNANGEVTSTVDNFFIKCQG